MIRPTLTFTILAIALSGCNKEEAPPPADDQAAEPQAETQPAATTPDPTPAPQPAFTTRVVRTEGEEEPWVPTATGTVDPGMSREDVIATWGEPAVERAEGDWTYLYFRNGCEISCGTFDIVFLQGNQVVDAVVRGRGHTYSGVSSSPPDRAPEFTAPDSAVGAMG